MDAFSYLSVLLSIILGLAITQVLKGFRGIMQMRSRLRTYWPAIAWAILVLVIAVQSWWAMFGLRQRVDWTFFEFSVVLAQTIVVYLLAALVLPDFFGDAAVDLREHYYDNHRWFFALAALLIVISVGKEFILTGRMPEPLNLGFQATFAVQSVAAMSTRNARFHELVTLFAAIGISAYIGVLFTHLG